PTLRQQLRKHRAALVLAVGRLPTRTDHPAIAGVVDQYVTILLHGEPHWWQRETLPDNDIPRSAVRLEMSARGETPCALSFGKVGKVTQACGEPTRRYLRSLTLLARQ